MIALFRDLFDHQAYADQAMLRAIGRHEAAAGDAQLRTLLHHTLLAHRFWLHLSQGAPFVPDEESAVQCAARLRSLGGAPPALDYVLWIKGGRPAPAWTE